MKKHVFLLLFLLLSEAAYAQRPRPIDPRATPEARRLLTYLYRVQKRHQTLTGMHNVLGRMSTNTDQLTEWERSYPAR